MNNDKKEQRETDQINILIARHDHVTYLLGSFSVNYLLVLKNLGSLNILNMEAQECFLGTKTHSENV